MTGRVCLASLMTLALSGVAAGATPVPDARYAGTTAQKGDHVVNLRTEGTSRLSRVRIQFEANRCGVAREGTRGTIAVRSLRVRPSGRFAKRGRQRAPIRGFGHQVERYSLRGRFVTSDRARGTLRVEVQVFNRAGLLVDTCDTRRAIRWSAVRIGDISEPYELPG